MFYKSTHWDYPINFLTKKDVGLSITLFKLGGNISMTMGHDELLLVKYKETIKLYIESINMYWKKYSIFMIFTGFLFAGFAQIIKYGSILATVYCIFGIYLAFLWKHVTRRALVSIDITEDIGRNLEKDLFIREKAQENLPDFKYKSETRNKDRQREMKLRGMGYFLANQRVLHHEFTDKYKDSWINERYSEKEIKLITKKEPIPIITMKIPNTIIIMWIILVIGTWFYSMFSMLNIYLP